MAGSQKKSAKGRLDKYYKLAKEQGYRSRAAFKLIQLNKKYGFLEKSKVVIDLCAAPGGWLQVASKQCKPGALIMGVDLVPIRPIPNCITFAEDINSDKCRAQLRQHMKTWKADCVVHDGAPNVGIAWLQDAYTQNELVLMSLKLACEFLIPGGVFVTKIFRSKDYNNLLYTMNQLFTKVEATKPQASRNVSAEVFVVCKGFKAPQKIDPRLLDPKSVFEDLPAAPVNQESKIFYPERRKRYREGYEEGNYTQHKIRPISEFVLADEPIQILGETQEFTFDGPENLPYKKLDKTTKEIKACCADLQVLNKNDFRHLLRWRLAARLATGLDAKKKVEESTEIAQVEALDEEEIIDEEIEKLNESQKAKLRRLKRREQLKRMKEITRMQLGMTADSDMVGELAGQGQDSMFALKAVEKRSAINAIVDGAEAESEQESEEEQEEELELEDQLDMMYERFRERMAEKDAHLRAKRARGDKQDDEWQGIDDTKETGSHASDPHAARTDSDDYSDTESSDNDEERLTKTLDPEENQKFGGLTKKAALFFDQDLFKVIEASSTSEEAGSDSASPAEEASEEKKTSKRQAKARRPDARKKVAKDKKNIKDSAFEEVPATVFSDIEVDEDKPRAKGLATVDIVTAEAMTIAHSIVKKEKSREDIVDEGFNKFAFYDKAGAPEWFLDDESVHQTANLPITKAAADALKEKMRAMNARPIKKILEARGRKKQQAMRVLSKITKKAENINDTEDLSEKQKAQSISRLLNRASKTKPKNKVQLVVAGGKGKGQSGQKKKGPYKMVDKLMKKQGRAERRIAKKHKKR